MTKRQKLNNENDYLEMVNDLKEQFDAKEREWERKYRELSTKMYHDGGLHGKQVFYREDGSIHFEMMYKDGKRDGKYVCYNEDGREESVSMYKHGKEVWYRADGRERERG